MSSLMRRRALERDPFSLLERMNQWMDSAGVGLSDDAGDLAAWSPSVNIYEKDGILQVEADLPGVKKEDIRVSVEGGVLSLSGERKQEEKLEKENLVRVERSYGSFSRSFTLPSDVDAQAIEASFADGVLKLRIPRSEQAKPKSIEIR